MLYLIEQNRIGEQRPWPSIFEVSAPPVSSALQPPCVAGASKPGRVRPSSTCDGHGRRDGGGRAAIGRWWVVVGPRCSSTATNGYPHTEDQAPFDPAARIVRQLGRLRPSGDGPPDDFAWGQPHGTIALAGQGRTDRRGPDTLPVAPTDLGRAVPSEMRRGT